MGGGLERVMFLLYFTCAHACAQVCMCTSVHGCKCVNECVHMCMSPLEWQAWVPWHAPCICYLPPAPPQFPLADISSAQALSPAGLK